MPAGRVATFRFSHHIYRADTCEPLREAVARGEMHLVARARGAYPGLPLPARALPEVRSVGYWDAEHNQSWGLDWHRNEGIEVTYVSRGKVHFAVDDQSFHLARGALTITRPWQLHRVGNPHVSACRLHWLILDVGMRRPNQPWNWPKWLVLSDTDLQRLTTMLSQNEQPVWQADETIAAYFEQLAETTAAYDEFEDGAGESHLALYINGLIVALTELLRRQRPVLDKSLSSTQRAVDLFLASLSDVIEEPWDVAAMAAACGLGRSRFAHYCKEITNMSPNEYLALCRVQVASRLLRDQPDLGVTEVALQCGFTSSQYFATVFHAHVGCSPRNYRRRELNDVDGVDAAAGVAPLLPRDGEIELTERSRAAIG